MKDSLGKRILLWIGAAAMFAAFMGPFLYMAAVSVLETPRQFGAGADAVFTLEHYRNILTTDSLHFLDYVRNSLIISGVSAAFCVLIAACAAYAITRLPLPAKAGILFFVLAVSMFPQISIVSYLFKFMTAMGWINTYPALILPYIAWVLPLSLWILVSYFAQLPRDLDDQALIDGCSRLQALVRIILPVAAPGIFSTALLAFIFAFNEFLFALMLTTDHHSRTIPVGIALFQGLHGQIPWGSITAAATITTIPIVILVLLFQRRIISGLTSGAVKE
mgnify:CR=1 FL=1